MKDINCKQWIWMMDYCRKEGIPPGNDKNWKKAELEYMKSKGLYTHEKHKKQYAQDEKDYKEPWKKWSYKYPYGEWTQCNSTPLWDPNAEYNRDEDAFKPQEFRSEYFSGLNWWEAEKYVGKMMEFSDSGNKWVTATLSKIITERDEIFRYVSKAGFRATYCRTCPETFQDPHPTIRITVNGKDYDLPKPETEVLKEGTKYWSIDPLEFDCISMDHWANHEHDKCDKARLKNGFVHLTKDRAKVWADFWKEIHKITK
jgi:hypothetical protein